MVIFTSKCQKLVILVTGMLNWGGRVYVVIPDLQLRRVSSGREELDVADTVVHSSWVI